MNNTKKKILIVEDEPAMREALKEKLTISGFSVIEGKDGEEGLKLAFNNTPDLILLDILMPRMDGMMMLKKVRETEWGKKVPVIILTNLSADEKITSEVVTDEPSYYLMKTDWPIEEIVNKVRSALGEEESKE